MIEGTGQADGQRPILMFDSGIGGLTVLREARVLMPDRRFVYVADDAAFPYGDWEEEALRARLIALFGELLVTYQPEIAVIPCNTASTLALGGFARGLSRDALRRHRAGHQAGGRAHALGAGVGAGDARHRQARLHARPHPVFCHAMPCQAGRQPEPCAHGGGLYPRRGAA